jgi:hypothetical protein
MYFSGQNWQVGGPKLPSPWSMAHHVETHFSQIAPLGFETTIDDNETSLAALVLILFVLFI